MKLPIFDASNVHSRAFGFVFVPVYRCFPAIYRAKKRNTKKKSANFVAKVPVKRRKTGSFSAKAAHLRTPLGFPPSALPFHGLIRPRFLRPVRTSARSLRTSTCRCGRCLGQATRCYAKCSRRSHGEGRSLGIARPHARRHSVHRRQPRKNAVHDREAVRKMTYRKNARTRKSIRTTETAAQTLHGFLRNAEGRAGKD